MERTQQERMGVGMSPYPQPGTMGAGPATTTTPRYVARETVTERGFQPGWLISAFAFGAAVGGVLGLLFAPRKGAEIREMLSENIGGEAVPREWRTRVNQAIASGRARPTDLTMQAQRELEDLRSQALNRLGDAKLRGKILQKEAQLRYLKGKERIRQM